MSVHYNNYAYRLFISGDEIMENTIWIWSIDITALNHWRLDGRQSRLSSNEINQKHIYVWYNI